LHKTHAIYFQRSQGYLLLCAITIKSHVHTSCSGIPFVGATTFLTKVVMINASRLHMINYCAQNTCKLWWLMPLDFTWLILVHKSYAISFQTSQGYLFFRAITMKSHVHTSCRNTFRWSHNISHQSCETPIDEDESLFFKFTNEFKEAILFFFNELSFSLFDSN